MSGAILFGLETLWKWQKRSSQLWLPGPSIGLCINLLFLGIYLIVPKFDYLAENKIGFESILQNSTYFLQGLIYPTAPLAAPLIGQLGLNDLNAIRLVGLLTLAPRIR